MSARPFVEAAVEAGYAVTVIDAFADSQTIALAEKSVVVGYGRCGFDAAVLLSEVQKLNLSEFQGCLYGSGFEAQPELLQKIAELVPILGNRAETVGAVKSGAHFFTELRKLAVSYPDVSMLKPLDSGRFLIKDAGGCGGMHINVVPAEEIELSGAEYYQRFIEGLSVSLLFIADGHDITVVGFNEQWLSPSGAAPFRYGGAVSHVPLSSVVQAQLVAAAEKLTLSFGLLGANSLDAIVHNDVVYVLELNPRLSATIDLYSDADFNLIEHHILVCQALGVGGGRRLENNYRTETSKAHAIVYADCDMEIAASFAWPETWEAWITDTPNMNGKVIRIVSGMPVCTVFAYDVSAQEAKALAQYRVSLVQDLIKQYIIKTAH